MGELELHAAVLTAITCQGRALNPDGQPEGDICGAQYQPWRGTNPITGARAAGWRIGYRIDGTPDAMCPRCAKPDPALTRIVRDLGRH